MTSSKWIGPPENPYLASVHSKHLPLVTKLRWIFVYWGLGAPLLIGLYITAQTFRGALKLLQWTLWKPCCFLYNGCFRRRSGHETRFTEYTDLKNARTTTFPAENNVVPRWIRHTMTSHQYGTWMADILSYGRHHPFKNLSSTTTKLPSLKEVIVVLPGNPGTIHFYHTFMAALGYNLRGHHETLVVGIGHSHHSKTSVPSTLPGVTQRHSLESQIRHKIGVLKQIREAHPNVRFVTVGHSVGSYMSLRVAEELGQEVTRKHVLLFPTVMHIGSTPNGVNLYPLCCYGRPLVGLSASLMDLLPETWKQPPIKARVGEQPHCVFGLRSIIHSAVAQNCLYMGKHEMEGMCCKSHHDVVLSLSHVGLCLCAEIRGVPSKLVEQHKDRLVWYFAKKDGWNRSGDYHEVLRLVEGENVHLCNRGKAGQLLQSYFASRSHNFIVNMQVMNTHLY